MLQFQRGSRAAFEEIFARHRDALHGFFRRRLANPAQADDLTQETFLAVLRGATRYEPRALVRTYLYAIALKLVYGTRGRAVGIRHSIDVRPRPLPLGSPGVGAHGVGRTGDPDVARIRAIELRSRLFRSRMALRSRQQFCQENDAAEDPKPFVDRGLRGFLGIAVSRILELATRKSLQGRRSGGGLQAGGAGVTCAALWREPHRRVRARISSRAHAGVFNTAEDFNGEAPEAAYLTDLKETERGAHREPFWGSHLSS